MVKHQTTISPDEFLTDELYNEDHVITTDFATATNPVLGSESYPCESIVVTSFHISLPDYFLFKDFYQTSVFESLSGFDQSTVGWGEIIFSSSEIAVGISTSTGIAELKDYTFAGSFSERVGFKTTLVFSHNTSQWVDLGVGDISTNYIGLRVEHNNLYARVVKGGTVYSQLVTSIAANTRYVIEGDLKPDEPAFYLNVNGIIESIPQRPLEAFDNYLFLKFKGSAGEQQNISLSYYNFYRRP